MYSIYAASAVAHGGCPSRWLAQDMDDAEDGSDGSEEGEEEEEDEDEEASVQTHRLHSVMLSVHPRAVWVHSTSLTAASHTAVFPSQNLSVSDGRRIRGRDA